MSLRMSKYESFRTGSINSPENLFITVRRRNYFRLSYLILQSSNFFSDKSSLQCCHPKTGRHSAASERDSSMRLLSQNATYFFVFCRKFASNAVRCENVLKTIQTFLLQLFTAVISDARLTGHWSASRTVPFSLSVQDFARFPFLFLHFRR